MILDSFDKIVNQKGSGTNLILGIVVAIVGIGIGILMESDLVLYLSLIAGLSLIISSFLIIIRQYERAIILRLGRIKRQIGPGIQA
jgi:regulator of protease activity HflC (stomatin/prohibitin superfamily)